jgi:lysophospholipase L1-like esterase
MDYILYILIVFVMAEILMAFVFYPFKNGKNYYSLKSTQEGGTHLFQYDNELGFSLKPNVIHKNPSKPLENAPRRIMFGDVRTGKNGFLFTENLDLLGKTEKLIFCVGGSTTMGAESRHDHTYPSILDSKLKNYGYRCINSGVSGYRSIHELLCLRKKILSYKPHAVILFSGYNDFEDFSKISNKPYDPFSHCGAHNLPTNNAEKVLHMSALFHFAKRIIYFLLKKIRTESITSSDLEDLNKSLINQTWLEEWQTNVGQFIDECNENKIKCFLLSHASPCFENASDEAKEFANKDLNMLNRFDCFVKYMKIIHNATISLCDKKGAHFIDIRDAFDAVSPFQKRFSLFVDRMHFTEEGNALLADSIFKKIKGIL